MILRLLTEHHLEFLSLKGGCTGSSESTLVKMSHSRLKITCDGSNVNDIVVVPKAAGSPSLTGRQARSLSEKSLRRVKCVLYFAPNVLQGLMCKFVLKRVAAITDNRGHLA